MKEFMNDEMKNTSNTWMGSYYNLNFNNNAANTTRFSGNHLNKKKIRLLHHPINDVCRMSPTKLRILMEKSQESVTPESFR